jgi:hypothetical protein
MSKIIGIAGGGISGLTCAYWLHQFNIPFYLFEKAQQPGGRIQTFEEQGFKLDAGFQVFLPAYPEAAKILSYDELQFSTFDAGAIIYNGSALLPFPDPLRQPTQILKVLKAPFLTFRDSLAMLRLFEETTALTQDEVFGPTMGTTAEYLKELNFSRSFIEHFWHPFFKGIFLESDLSTEARFFRFLFKCFKQSLASLPARGMQQIPISIANKLPSNRIKMNFALQLNHDESVEFPPDFGEYAFKVVAFDKAMQADSAHYHGTTTLYYVTPERLKRKSIYLNASAGAVVNNVAFVADVNPNYSPDNRGLAAVSIVDTHKLTDKDKDLVLTELNAMFGEEVAHWQLLKEFFIPHALPKMAPKLQPALKIEGNTIYVGDHTTYPSINGAMLSGRLAAEWIRDRMN